MKKMLVVYYSWSAGNTERVARQLARACDADVERIETVERYPDDYQTTVDQAKREITSGYEPEINPLVHDPSDYDVIAVGTPVWWYTMAPAIKTFLSQTDLSGKTVVAFNTSGGWPGTTIEDIERACKGATFLPSIEVSPEDMEGSNQKTPRREIDSWIEGIREFLRTQ